MLDKIASYFIYIRLCSIQRGYSHPYIQATFTPAANYGAQGIQLCDGGLILCWRRIRKFDENRQTENRHTENSKPEATLIPVDRRGERANINVSMDPNS